MERIVHLTNGDHTADTLSLADLPGEIRVWADALDQGPVLPVSDAEHYKARTEFHATRGGGPSVADYDRGLDEAAGAEELICRNSQRPAAQMRKCGEGGGRWLS